MSNFEENLRRAEGNIEQAENIIEDIETREEDYWRQFIDDKGKNVSEGKVIAEGLLDQILKNIELKINVLYQDIQNENYSKAEEEMEEIQLEVEEFIPVVREIFQASDNIERAIAILLNLVAENDEGEQFLAEAIVMGIHIINIHEVLESDTEDLLEKLDLIFQETGHGEEIIEILRSELSEADKKRGDLKNVIDNVPERYLSQIKEEVKA